MARLDGKKVKIDGKKYTVKSHMANVDGGVETIILTRAIGKTSKESFRQKPADTIQELGYMDEDDVVYTPTEMEVGEIQIKEKIGETIKITMILHGGVIQDTELKIIGPNWESPDHIDIIFLEQDNEEASIDRELLVQSYLLWQERHNKFIPNKEDQGDEDISESKPEIEELLGGLDGILGSLFKDIKDPNRSESAASDLLKDILGPSYGKKSRSEAMDDILKHILDDKKSDRGSERRRGSGIDIQELDLSDAPPEIQEIIRKLRNRRSEL